MKVPADDPDSARDGGGRFFVVRLCPCDWWHDAQQTIEVLAELEAELSPFVASDYEDDTISREELEESLELEEEDVLIEDLMKDKLRATQIAALQKVGIATEEDAFEYIYNDGGDAMSALLGIKGISDKSANIILDTLCYEA